MQDVSNRKCFPGNWVETEDYKLPVLMLLSSKLCDDGFSQRLAAIMTNSLRDWLQTETAARVDSFGISHNCQWNLFQEKVSETQKIF